MDAGMKIPIAATLGRETADVETSSEGYARRFAGEVGEHFLAVQARVTLDLLAPWPGGTVLDVGGGHGQLAAPLAAAGYRVTVAGSSEACRERLDRLLPPGAFDFRAADLLALPFPDLAFDVVLAFRLLPHAERWRELLGEMCRLARRAVRRWAGKWFLPPARPPRNCLSAPGSCHRCC